MKRIIANFLSINLLLCFFAVQPIWGKEKIIVTLGDSLIAGYNLPYQDSLPAQLLVMLAANGHNVKIFNAGVSGDTSKAAIERVDWILNEQSDLVIVVLGGNDLLRGLKPEETYRNLDAIISKLLKNKRKVLFIGMKAPPNYGKKFQDDFDYQFKKLNEKYNNNRNFYFDEFFLTGIYDKPEYMLSDNKHPNKKGFAYIAERLFPIIENMLRQ